jgi:hypothetical protein
MSATLRPDNLRAALDAKLAAALSQLVELREAEQPRATVHLSPREIVGAFLLYACGVYPIADKFGRAQAGELQFNAWYEQWMKTLNAVDGALWRHLRDARARLERGQVVELIEVELSIASDASAVTRQPLRGAEAGARKQLVRFAAYPDKPASDVCNGCLQVARRFVHDFIREHRRFLP